MLYEALINLSVPMKEAGTERRTELIPVGGTVELDDDTAARFMPPAKPVAMIRPAKDKGMPSPRLTARHVSGPLRVPAGVRADPPGSSQELRMAAPEANEPSPGDETVVAEALDIAPTGAGRAAAARAGRGRG